MVSGHLNFLLQETQKNTSSHLPAAMVLESNGGQYCYAFRPYVSQPQYNAFTRLYY